MTRLQLQQIPMFQTAAISEAIKADGAAPYIMDCLLRCYAGDYGIVPAEDTAANNSELEAGEGHILAHYPAGRGLDSDIYIDIHFSESNPGEACNYGMVMYCHEW